MLQLAMRSVQIFVVLGVSTSRQKGSYSGYQYQFGRMSFLNGRHHSDKSDHPALLIRSIARLNGARRFVFVEFAVFDVL